MASSHPVSIIIVVRVDTPDRLRNLEFVLRFLFSALDRAELIVIEQSAESRCRNVTIQYGAEYHFFETNGCFYKSRLLNFGIGIARHEIVLVYDTDVLIQSGALREAFDQLAGGQADFVFPYNGAMVQVKENRLSRGFDPQDEFLDSAPFCELGGSVGDDPDFEYLYGNSDVPSAGGALAGLRRSFVYYGGYNENIVSYGCEDVELASRLEILGAQVKRLPHYNCYHMQHRRGPDSNYNNFLESNLREWEKVRAMSRAALWRYVRNGFRDIVLDTTRELNVVNSKHEYAMSLAQASLPNAGDIDFILSFDSRTDDIAPVNIVHDLLSGLFSNFRLILVECNGDRWSEATHHTHTQLVRWHEQESRGWLETILTHADREVLVFVPWGDVPAGEVFRHAVEAARRDGISGAELAALQRGRIAGLARKRSVLGVETLYQAAVEVRRDEPAH